MDFKPEPVSRAREQVESQLREAILSGSVKRGERLPSESELAADFGVSRTTVREALRSLASAGLISKTPGARGGSFVEIVDHHSLGGVLEDSIGNTLRLGAIDYDEVTQLRRIIEIPSARMAAENRAPEDLERLEELLNRQKGITVEHPEVPRLDAGFHSAVADASGNRVLASFVSAFHSVTRPVLNMDLQPEIGKHTVRQHAAIVRAISDGDPDSAASAMQEHLDYIQSVLDNQPARE